MRIPGIRQPDMGRVQWTFLTDCYFKTIYGIVAGSSSRCRKGCIALNQNMSRCTQNVWAISPPTFLPGSMR